MAAFAYLSLAFYLIALNNNLSVTAFKATHPKVSLLRFHLTKKHLDKAKSSPLDPEPMKVSSNPTATPSTNTMNLTATKPSYRSTSTFLTALKVYKDQFGNLSVPCSYVCPVDPSSPYPPTCRGLKLGIKVDSIRRSRRKLEKEKEQKKEDGGRGVSSSLKSRTTLTPKLIEELDAMGFEWNLRQRLSPQDVLTALKLYHKLYGNLKIPRSFVVPASSPVWPQKLWGVKLGWRVAHIRGRGDYCSSADADSFKEELDRIDFEWVTSRLWKDEEFNYILSGLLHGYTKGKGRM